MRGKQFLTLPKVCRQGEGFEVGRFANVAAEPAERMTEAGMTQSCILLPKPTGGRRTTAIFPDLIGVWEALRVDSFRIWMQKL